jgi:Ca2+-binding EF-hand superfamily protein
MGGGKSKSTILKDTELNEFKNLTSFPNDIVIKLHNHYKHFSSVQIDDGVIDYSEFCALINRQNELTKRIFNSIDVNRDGVINFREFIKFISCFINGTNEEQIQLSFKIFSTDNNKLIDKKTICLLIREIMSNDKNLNSFFDDNSVDIIVNETFSQYASEENCINYDNYKALIQKYPRILIWLRVDLDKIKSLKEENQEKFRCFS